MFQRTKHLCRAINGSLYRSSKHSKNSFEATTKKINLSLIRCCTTANTSATFKRGIAQVAKQEKIDPSIAEAGNIITIKVSSE